MELSAIPDPQAKWAKAVEVSVLAKRSGTTRSGSTTTSTTCRGLRTRRCSSAGPRSPRSVNGHRASTSARWSAAREFKGYDYEFLSANERIAVLRETVEIVKSMWSEPDTHYDGKYFTLQGAQCDPKPLQQPHPPIWIGGGGEQLTLRVVARHADCSNFGGKPHEFQHKCEVLQEHCRAVGRDYDEIAKTWSPELFVRETEQEVIDAGSKSFWGEPFESWRDGNLVGTPEQVAEKLQAYADLGCTGFVPWCSDYPDTTSMRLFGEKVIPNFH